LFVANGILDGFLKRSERAGHAADGVDEVAGHIGRIARLNVRQLVQQLETLLARHANAEEPRPGENAL